MALYKLPSGTFHFYQRLHFFSTQCTRHLPQWSLLRVPTSHHSVHFFFWWLMIPFLPKKHHPWPIVSDKIFSIRGWMKARLGGEGFIVRGEGFTVGRGEGYIRPEGVYNRGSSGRGWLFDLQRRSGEEATQATVILQRLVERDFARWNGRQWDPVAACWGQVGRLVATAVWKWRV